MLFSISVASELYEDITLPEKRSAKGQRKRCCPATGL